MNESKLCHLFVIYIFEHHEESSIPYFQSYCYVSTYATIVPVTTEYIIHHVYYSFHLETVNITKSLILIPHQIIVIRCM